ncbi:MAG: hypothetical protein JRH20_18715 [Deltaproteobacteria bacterium]|nr:hypothetical protein [Deltaproteobacteria bacterium]
MQTSMVVPGNQISPILPAALSLMLPGLGQVYNRQLGKGVAVFFFAFLVVPYFYGILDAYFTARANNRKERFLTPAFVPLLSAPPVRSLEQELLDAARARGGDLSVTEGVMATGRGFDEVEAQLDAMCVSGYVDIGNRAESGVVVYRFGQL